MANWILLGIAIIAVIIKCLLIWYQETVIEHVDADQQAEQEDVNLEYITEQMNEEQIKLTIKKLNE